jgi:3-oxoacyl-(acyl-carrier-protein) synthase
VGLNATAAVISGMGVISGLGEDLDSFWDGLLTGRSAIRGWRSKDARIDSKVGGDLGDFDLGCHLDRFGARYPSRLRDASLSLLRSTPLHGTLTAAAALQAWVNAGLDRSPARPERMGHVCAGHNLSLAYICENLRTFEEEPDFIEPLLGVVSMDTDAVAVTCELLELKGPSFLVGGACASGNLAVISALDLIRAGRADVVLVTGAPVALESIVLHAWAMIDAVSVRSFNDEPERASRPFDALREGFVPSEAAGALVLESVTSARQRGVVGQATVLGGAATSDAFRLTRPSQEGQERAMRDALRDAQVESGEVDYVNAHATSTPLGDAVEAAAIKAALGPRAREIPVNSTKSMIGHCLTSAGVMELIATVLQMRHGVVHPTINQEVRDPDLDLDFVPNYAREHRVRLAMSNSFGFGGINSCVVVGGLL